MRARPKFGCIDTTPDQEYHSELFWTFERHPGERATMKKAELKDMLGSKQASIARNLTHQEVPCNVKFPGFVHHKPAALDRELDVPS